MASDLGSEYKRVHSGNIPGKMCYCANSARPPSLPTAMTEFPIRRLIVAITGASGSILGVELLRAASRMENVETHLVVSAAGYLTALAETGLSRGEIDGLADVVYPERNIGARISSGSFPAHAMVVAPCSMNTLGCIANGVSQNLVGRAADVVLKERRRLILLARETPLNLAHLRNMVRATEMGAVVFPPVPAYYTQPPDLATVVRETVGRVLAICGLENDLYQEWSGLPERGR